MRLKLHSGVHHSSNIDPLLVLVQIFRAMYIDIAKLCNRTMRGRLWPVEESPVYSRAVFEKRLQPLNLFPHRPPRPLYHFYSKANTIEHVFVVFSGYCGKYNFMHLILIQSDVATI